MNRYLYLAPTGEAGAFEDDRLDATTERHRITLSPPALGALDVCAEIVRDKTLAGVVIEMYVGWPGRDRLVFVMRILRRKRRVWLYWPEEQAIECVDWTRLWSHWRHLLLINTYEALREPIAGLVADAAARDVMDEECVARLFGRSPHFEQPRPIPWRHRSAAVVPGLGLYLRTDFWNQFDSGGSYGHTCYVAKELAATTERLVSFLTQRYGLLDRLGVHQVVMSAPSKKGSESDLIAATPYYYRILKPALEALRPAYIYERLCLGNYTAALLSQELAIPYIVEYNGSELSMHRSFGVGRLVHEDLFIRAEDFAFRQATVISVVSAEVKSTLVRRGVNPDKILTNPNGVDTDTYAPLADEPRRALRQELGFGADDVVIGFTGTFGGWHGVGVLAAAVPRICAAARQAKFLLIGDGDHKHLVDAAIERTGNQDRVRSVGRVPQDEGARLLPACDIFLSPHSAHMTDGRFFGSPTKLFEYMAIGGGIVASDLEQIGQVLSPAVRPDQLSRGDVTVRDERAVLVTPGSVDELVDAVLRLLRRPDIRLALGHNARVAACDSYSWRRHVENLWKFARKEQTEDQLLRDLMKSTKGGRALAAADRTGSGGVTVAPAAVITGDAYKDEVQRQWNHNAAGSHYVRDAPPHTVEWFDEAERYRYRDYAPWMHELMEFSRHRGESVLEIGAGMGTDLVQFARHGASVTDLDLSIGHLQHAQENFRLRGLTGRFVHHDAETLPFDDETYDVIYSNGVLHHTPNTHHAIEEIYRVLKPGGKAIVMVYAESSLHYWWKLVWQIGLEQKGLKQFSMGELMSRTVEITETEARPLVKVYTKGTLRRMFRRFRDVHVYRRQLILRDLPERLRWMPLDLAGRLMGWNLIVKARKPS